MPKRLENNKKHFARSMSLFLLYAVLFYITSLTSAHTLNAQPVGPPSTTFPPPPTTLEQQRLQQNQSLLSSPQFPQISWDELEEARSFIANGNMDSTLYTSN